MKFLFRTMVMLTGWMVLHAGAAAPMPVRAVASSAVVPIGETHPFRGILRARDLRLGTLSLGSSSRINRVLAVDAGSRLFKGNQPATLADFAEGERVEGFAFPDPYGRMVVAVATVQARAPKPRDARPPKEKKVRPPRASSGGRRRAIREESATAVPPPKPSAAVSAPSGPGRSPSIKAAPAVQRGLKLSRAPARRPAKPTP